MLNRHKRDIPEINTSSLADISFLLLLFFILTSSMGPDRIMPVRLSPTPPKQAERQHIKINERNYLPIYIDEHNQIFCRSEKIEPQRLKAYAKAFIANPENDSDLPERMAIALPLLGDVEITQQHVISLSNHEETLFQTHVFVQNEVLAAYRELRDELSSQSFGKPYSELNPEQQQEIRQYYPRKISRAEKIRKATGQ